MEQRKRGRKQLGNKKRYHNVMLRFNDSEYEKLKVICESFNLDISKRGTISPLLRRLVLNQKADEKDRLPDTSNLAYQINKIGNNINQLVKLAHHKNLRNPNVGLQDEMQRTNGLLLELVEILGEKKTG
ncbi:MobC family plasmid mobilization relaxosome protein [Flagellimonas marinaquae]|uniref:plasmid mobilization protein n=1 Tax=Flagellimonas TaxID=444459 RepID=UPI001CE0AE66|nr:plasmid mobilization relaxosome protein MobC [Muricauda sp. DH64]UBZ12437.1 MobC family plasmid mobilization relaxosome protein [Allomuricauda aquimarina]